MGMKCQIFFNYFESNVENSIKNHEQNISNIAVQICDTENFVYRPDWKTIDILLLLNLLNKREVVCFQIAGNLEEDKESVAIVLEAAVSETTLKLSRDEELFMWGPAIQPKYGLNSKLDIIDLRQEYAPSEFPGSER